MQKHYYNFPVIPYGFGKSLTLREEHRLVGEEVKLLVGKPERKRALGRPRQRSVDNVMIDLGGRMGWSGLHSLAQNRDKLRALVNAVMNLQVP
jgi:hypothetical protein